MRVCSKCKVEKPLSEFYKRKAGSGCRDNVEPSCKKCRRESVRAYRLANADKVSKSKRDWNTKNRERLNERRKVRRAANVEVERERERRYAREKPDVFQRSSWKRQGIDLSPDEYNELFDAQGGRCAICTRHQSEFSKALGVDHSHESGQVRGLLCSECNLGLGKFRDDPEVLLNAVDYLIGGE